MGEGAQEAPTLVWARREPRRRTWRTCRTWLTVRAADLIDSGESRASPVESSAALFSTAQTISVQVRPALCRSSTQVKQRHHDDDEVPRRPTGRQIFSSEQPKDMPTADHIFLFCCVCVCVRVRVRVGFWVAMADQGQTPGRPLVTTSAGRGSNTLRGPSGSWPGSSPSRRRAPGDWPYGNHTAGTSRLATRAAGLNDPLRQEGTWEAPIN